MEVLVSAEPLCKMHLSVEESKEALVPGAEKTKGPGPGPGLETRAGSEQVHRAD